ncbi:hypothetical protein [Mesorhizobium sp. AA22]|nr:hypothetical protein [Mesorhizobium sp. AA22]QIA21560.1 hypothetical protein A9K68_006880 [Mesorhizobium sp. AA22]
MNDLADDRLDYPEHLSVYRQGNTPAGNRRPIPVEHKQQARAYRHGLPG